MDEAERRRIWTALPLRVRTAIWRMHHQFGHPSLCALARVLRATRAPPNAYKLVDVFGVDRAKTTNQHHRVVMLRGQKDCALGGNLEVDVFFEVEDSFG